MGLDTPVRRPSDAAGRTPPRGVLNVVDYYFKVFCFCSTLSFVCSISLFVFPVSLLFMPSSSYFNVGPWTRPEGLPGAVSNSTIIIVIIIVTIITIIITIIISISITITIITLSTAGRTSRTWLFLSAPRTTGTWGYMCMYIYI